MQKIKRIYNATRIIMALLTGVIFLCFILSGGIPKTLERKAFVQACVILWFMCLNIVLVFRAGIEGEKQIKKRRHKSQIPVKVIVRCNTCLGTKLKPGVTVPKGIGVVCPDCGGTGHKEEEIYRFLKPVRVDGIEKVVLTSDGLADPDKTVDLTGAVSYKDFFERNKMPTT